MGPQLAFLYIPLFLAGWDRCIADSKMDQLKGPDFSYHKLLEAAWDFHTGLNLAGLWAVAHMGHSSFDHC